MKNRIGLIGHLATGQEKFDGQTVSTRMWQNQLEKYSNNGDIVVVDTWNYKRRFFSIFSSLIACMFSCTHIVFMLSGNGMQVMLPFLYYANKIFKRKIYHRVIGGNICNYVEKNPRWVKYLNYFEVNWVQSPKMVERLLQQGVSNAEFLENFRNSKPIEEDELTQTFLKPFLFCTFCRVSKAKGITVAIDAIANINMKRGSGTAELHIYGPIEEGYKEEFLYLTKLHGDCVKYMGSIASEKAVDTLKNYYFHLFPTTWGGEGFPGTLIDCYNAGVPTIASNWAYNAEYIKHAETGYLYDWEHSEMLEKMIEVGLDDSFEQHFHMRKNNINEAKKYSAEIIMKKIISRITNC